MYAKFAKWAFPLALFACAQFVVLTVVAMLVYPGGSYVDPTTTRYSFFENFFSELGVTVTGGGEPNPIASVLFFIALTLAGLGLAIFFVAVPRFFRGTRAALALSVLGSVAGVLSGFAFVGIAFTPANLYLSAHGQFVLAAFELFLVAVVFYTAAIFASRRYPHVYAWVYLAFAVLLAAYVVLLFGGPGLGSAQGVIIQATGQKIIVYAALLTTFIQAYGALRMNDA